MPVDNMEMYVSFEVAKVLEDTKFDGDWDFYYDELGYVNLEDPRYVSLPLKHYKCPTINEVRDWLKRLGITIKVRTTFLFSLPLFDAFIYDSRSEDPKREVESFFNFDKDYEVLNCAILYCLKNLIK